MTNSELPKGSNAYIQLATHIIPLYIDEDNTIWRMNKNGGIKSIPLDRSYSKYKIIHVGKST